MYDFAAFVFIVHECGIVPYDFEAVLGLVLEREDELFLGAVPQDGEHIVFILVFGEIVFCFYFLKFSVPDCRVSGLFDFGQGIVIPAFCFETVYCVAFECFVFCRRY